jgi:hypothetical protein
VNRRIAGRVKHAQKRAKVRADIRAGRRISMQAFVNGTAEHTHTHEVEAPVLTVEPSGEYKLVRLTDGEALAFGTEYAMRKMRKEMTEMDGPAVTYQVRKVK